MDIDRIGGVGGGSPGAGAEALSEATKAERREIKNAADSDGTSLVAQILEDQAKRQAEQFQESMREVVRVSGFQATLDTMRQDADTLVKEIDSTTQWSQAKLDEQAKWVVSNIVDPTARLAVNGADWTYTNLVDPLAQPDAATAASKATDWLKDRASDPAQWTANNLTSSAVNVTVAATWVTQSGAATGEQSRDESRRDE